jgi:hypothetical protein
MPTKTPPAPDPPPDPFKVSLAEAMAPLLFAVATFSLTLLRETANPTRTCTDEIFAVLSGVCLLGSSTSADAALDEYKFTTWERLKFLNLGYLLFCLAIGTLTAAVPILYAETEGRALWWGPYWVFGLTGFVVAAKPMVYREPLFKYSVTWSMGIFMSSLLLP